MKTQKKIISSFLFLLTLLGTVVSAKGQGIQNLSDLNGTVLKTNTYSEVQGSPFLTNSWSKGVVKFVNGRVLNQIDIKYDEVKDELLFKGKDNEEYYFSDLINEFSLAYVDKNQIEVKKRFINGFNPDKKLSEKSFYEVLVDGKSKLLKRSNKSITETKEYNAAASTKEVTEEITFYIGKNGTVTPIKKNDIKTIASIIDAEKATEIINYSNKNNINPKTETGLIKIITYYNTL